MSTKTTTKRLALATVVALGAGVLSLVTVSSASAAAYTGPGANLAAGGASNPSLALSGVLYQASIPSTTGSATASTTLASNNSVGLINTSDIAGTLVAGTTQTATLLSTGALTVYESGTGVGYDEIQVTGGTITSAAGIAALNTASTLASTAQNGVATSAVTVKPNSGVTSMTVSLYSSATASGSTSGGTLTGFITVTIASSSAAGVVSPAKSGIYYSSGASGTGHMGLSADDTTAGLGTAAYNASQYADIRVVDAFSTAITTGGILQVTATNGALVSLGTAAAAGTSNSTPTLTTAVSTTAPDNSPVRVINPANTPLSTVITVSYNGVVVGTKSFTFTGDIAKITLSAPSTGVIGGTASSTGTATIAFADSAGNAIYPTVSGASYPSQNLVTDGTTTNASVTGGSVAVAAQLPTSTTSGVWTFTCGTAAGSASLVTKFTNLDGTVATSNALAVNCAGTAYTYTAALDKATYAPGDIATLQVTFKDSKGFVAADTSAVASSTYVPSISGGYLTGTSGSSTTAGTATDALTNGVATYKFVVGAPTVDPYNGQLIVSFGAVNANGVAGTQTVGYKITTGSGATSLNDVLKGIVSLIASINKQIAALAKLVTKKK